MKKLIFTLLVLCACEATWAVGYNQTEWADSDRDAATVYVDSQTGLSFYVLDGSAVLTYAEASSSNYSSLTSLTLPETVSDGSTSYTVTKVGDYAFDHASNIKGELIVPANILTLGRSAFEGCTGITSVTIDYAETALANGNNQNWGTPFYSCSGITTVTLNRDLTQGRPVASGYRTELFSDLTNIETVYIGENVTEILHDLFNCNSSSSCKLATVYCYATTVPTLGSLAFDSHTGLTLHVYESLGDAYNASDWATYFSNIMNDLPDPEIEDGALKDVETGLYFSFVEINDVNYLSIIPDALGVYSNDNLVKNSDGSYTLPTSVQDASGEGGNVTRIGDNAFAGATISGHLVIPAHITTMGISTFKNCTGLTEVTYEYSETAVKEENAGSSSGAVDITFEGCTNIETVNLNRNITLGSGTRHVGPFEYINGVTKVTIGENVTEIPNFLVRNTSTKCLAEVYCYPTTVPTTNYDPFGNLPDTGCTLYVPKGCKDIYSSAAYSTRSYTGDNATTWGEYFTDIVEMEGEEVESGTFVCDVDPADKKIISELSQVTFTNPNGGEILTNDDYPTYPEFNVYDEEGKLVTIMNNVTPIEENGLVMAQVLTFGYGDEDEDGNSYPSVVTEEGTYYVTVPAEIFIIYDEDGKTCYNEAMTLTYTVSADAVEEPDYTLVISPESGSTLESLSTISISCEDGIMWNTLGWADIVIYDGENNELENEVNWDEVSSSSGAITEVVLTISPTITAEGDYSVVIPEGYFLISGTVECKAITLEYTIKENAGTETGIRGISINDENVEGIYSTSGQKLNTTAKGVNIIRFSDGSVKKLYVK